MQAPDESKSGLDCQIMELAVVLGLNKDFDSSEASDWYSCLDSHGLVSNSGAENQL